MVAAAIAGSAVAGVAGSALKGMAAGNAAGAQADAARQAAMLQQQQYERTRADLVPFTETGQSLLPAYGSFWQNTAGDLSSAYNTAAGQVPPMMTQAELEKTPGWSWNLSQGLKAVQNSAAARGLGVSGNALKGAATYATGLADSTYQNQFNNQQQRFQDYQSLFGNKLSQDQAVFGQLQAPVATGESAGAQTGTSGIYLANAAGTNLASAGQATAAGITKQADALSSGLSDIGSAGMNYLLYNKLLKGTA